MQVAKVGLLLSFEQWCCKVSGLLSLDCRIFFQGSFECQWIVLFILVGIKKMKWKQLKKVSTMQQWWNSDETKEKVSVLLVNSLLFILLRSFGSLTEIKMKIQQSPWLSPKKIPKTAGPGMMLGNQMKWYNTSPYHSIGLVYVHLPTFTIKIQLQLEVDIPSMDRIGVQFSPGQVQNFIWSNSCYSSSKVKLFFCRPPEARSETWSHRWLKGCEQRCCMLLHSIECPNLRKKPQERW